MRPKSTSAMIRQMHIFAGLNESALGALAAACRRFKARPGKVLVREGEPGRDMFLIGEGKVEVIKRAGTPNRVVLATLGAGDLFGEMSLVECRTRSATIRCVEPCVLYSLKSADLLKFFRRFPKQYAVLILNIARHLSRRLRRMDEVFAATAF